MTKKPEPKRPLRMADIAHLAGVSESTVSRALADNPAVNARTRAIVRQVAAEAGYRINAAARSLRSRRTATVTVAVPLVHESEQPLSDPFMMTMLALLAEELTRRGYSMLLSKVPAHVDHWVEDLFHPGQTDGVILIGQSFEHAAIEAASVAEIPIVVWGARRADQSYVSVGTDNRLGGALATRHLVSTGRRCIAFLGDERLPEIAHRFQGYRGVVEESGLRFDPLLHARAPFSAALSYTTAKALLAKCPEIDGLVAASDVIAGSAIRALAESGRSVPRDVSVVGYDDIPLASLGHPSLTTVRQDLKRGAALLVEKLLSVIGGGPAEPVVLPPELIVRESA